MKCSASAIQRSCAAVAAAAVLASCRGGNGQRAAVAPSSTASSVTSTTSTTTATTTSSPHDGNPHYAVGTTVVDLVDNKRGRTLHTIIHFPAKAGNEPAAGSFPLVLMAHGFRLPAGGYERTLGTVTAAGYIVAAPAFPHTSAERDGNRSDIVNQPADLSFVADAVIDLATHQPGRVPPVADPNRVAALGHSDGGITVLAWGYDDAYRDRRVAAVVSMAGAIAFFRGTYFAADSPPLLVMHATGDQTNPYSASVNVFNRVPPGIPHYMVTIAGGSHLGPYMYDTALPEVGQVIVDFLDAYFLGQAGARQRLVSDGDRPGVTTIRSG